MSKTKKLVEDLHEQGAIKNPEQGSERPPRTETFVLVKPELFDQVVRYLHNSTPSGLTVQEVLTLITSLNQTSKKSEVTFN